MNNNSPSLGKKIIFCLGILVLVSWIQEVEPHIKVVTSKIKCDREFYFHVFRRKQEHHSLPNIFLGVNNENNLIKDLVTAYYDNDIQILQLQLNLSCLGGCSLGKNHITENQFKYWSHNNPKLYKLVVSATNMQGDTIANCQSQIGVVDYRFDKNLLMVNNKTINFKSVNIKTPISKEKIISLKRHHVNTFIYDFIPDQNELVILNEIGIYCLLNMTKLINSNYQENLAMVGHNPCIAGFISHKEEKLTSISWIDTNIPSFVNLPNNVTTQSLEESNFHEIRDIFQPFLIKIKEQDSMKNQGYKFEIDATETYFEDKPIIYHFKISNGSSQLVTNSSDQKWQFFPIDDSSNTSDIHYQITALANEEFGVFEKSDTIAHFNKIFYR